MQSIVIFGIQGSGKGTQAKLLSEALCFKHINIGDLLREQVSHKSVLGQKVQKIIGSGSMVNDELIFDLVKSILDDSYKGIVFDGFPRTLAQAEYLVQNFEVCQVIYLDLSESEAVSRISSRRVCPQCLANYNILSKKPRIEGICDVCGSTLQRREDDCPIAIRKRLKNYYEQTQQLTDYFSSLALLFRVDASQSEADIFAVIQDRIKSLWANK